MGERIQGGNSFFQYPPSGLHAASPHRTHSLPSDQDTRYLTELLGEKQKFQPFMQVLPLCSWLLNQEIRRISGYNSALLDHDGLDHEGHCRSSNPLLNGRPLDIDRWSVMQTEENGHLQKVAQFQASPIGWPGAMCIQSTPVVKKVIRLDVPVGKNPNYNFVGRILGRRGDSLKRFETMTQCRVYIRGKGSVKDSVKEEMLKDKPGYEHLNEPPHILVEAEFPEDMVNLQMEQALAILEDLLKPVVRTCQKMSHRITTKSNSCRNYTLREESPGVSPNMSPSMSPFGNSGMKRAKTGRRAASFLDHHLHSDVVDRQLSCLLLTRPEHGRPMMPELKQWDSNSYFA